MIRNLNLNTMDNQAMDLFAFPCGIDFSTTPLSSVWELGGTFGSGGNLAHDPMTPQSPRS
jgi:hypothetical protein